MSLQILSWQVYHFVTVIVLHKIMVAPLPISCAGMQAIHSQPASQSVVKRARKRPPYEYRYLYLYSYYEYYYYSFMVGSVRCLYRAIGRIIPGLYLILLAMIDKECEFQGKERERDYSQLARELCTWTCLLQLLLTYHYQLDGGLLHVERIIQVARVMMMLFGTNLLKRLLLKVGSIL